MKRDKDKTLTKVDKMMLRFLIRVFQAALWINEKTGLEITIEI